MYPTCYRRPALASTLVLAFIAGTTNAQIIDDPFPPVFALSSLLPANGGDGSLGVVLNGPAANARAGRSASSAGDINNDGIEDLIVGANSNTGVAYIIFGRGAGNEFPPEFELSSLDGTNGFRIFGTTSNSGLGVSVSGAGDVNNDGIDDIIVGAPYSTINGMFQIGSAFVIFGRDDGFPATLDLSSLDGTNGFRINGEVRHDRLGLTVANAGDLNNDGIDDIACAYTVDSYNSDGGSALIIYGRDISNTGAFPAVMQPSYLDGTTGFRVNGGVNNVALGHAISTAGDINGDGIDDLLLGDENGDGSSGRALVLFGRDTANEGNFAASIDADSMDGTNGFHMTSVTVTLGFLGGSVANAGDVNGDGFDDIVMGGDYTPIGSSYYRGVASVVFGGDSAFPATLDLGSLNGENGFNFYGSGQYNRVGRYVAGAGDVNGDGFDDMLITAVEGSSYYDTTVPGKAYVVYGRPLGDPFPAVLFNNSLDGSNGFRLDGISPGDAIGYPISGNVIIGDFNADGVDDLVICASRADPNGSNSGEIYIVYGRNTVCAADYNNDGSLDFFDVQAFLADFAIQNPLADINGDGSFDFFDIQAFLNLFVDGCSP